MKRQTNVYNKETRRQLTKLWLHSDVPETIHQTWSNINPNTEYSTQACAWPEHFFLESLVVELAKTIVAELSLCLLADSCLLRWVSGGCVCASSQALAARGDGSSPTAWMPQESVSHQHGQPRPEIRPSRCAPRHCSRRYVWAEWRIRRPHRRSLGRPRPPPTPQKS